MAIFNIGILFTFKYLNFTIFSLDNMVGAKITQTAFVLPIGISFFTFHAMSYVIDISRGSANAQKNLLDTALYISLFPALVAGPIIRYNTVADQLRNRNVSIEDFSEGLRRFIIGFAKKLIIANTVAACADQAFSTNTDGNYNISVLLIWLGAICYTMQIYFDFSGYSDMAIGLGRMFGFRLAENFNYPYISKSITEFWRRWHISLSSWFRDYVYIPLGGSRVDSRLRLVFNLFVTWMLTGIWHGANWTFIVWGFCYFFLLTFEKLAGIPQRVVNLSVLGIFYRIFTILCFVFGWVIFRASDLTHAITYLKAMVGKGFIGGHTVWSDVEAQYLLSEYAIILLIAVLIATPVPKMIFERIFNDKKTKAAILIIKNGLYIVLFFLALSFMASSEYNPFIYFNF